MPKSLGSSSSTSSASGTLFTLGDLLQSSIVDDHERRYREKMSSMHSAYPNLFGQNTNSRKNGGGGDSASSSNEGPSSRQSRSAVNLASCKMSQLLDNPGPVEPQESMGRRKLARAKREKRNQTKGAKWFDLPAVEMTAERKRDLDFLSMRSALASKDVKYKRNNLPTRPKHFHIGTVVDNAPDFYHSRIPKRQRKKTLAEEMVAEISSTVADL